MASVDVAPLTLAGVGVTVSPCGAPVTARSTAPVKPLARVTVTVAEPAVPPAATDTVVGARASEKLPAGAAANVAVTLCAALSVTAHVGVVFVQAPLQPVNVLPFVGAAVSVTAVPLGKLLAHVVGQVMPAGLEVTVPVPVPAVVTVSPKVATT